MGWMREQPTHRGIIVEWAQHADGRHWGFIRNEFERPDRSTYVWFGERALSGASVNIGKGDLVKYVLFDKQAERKQRLAACKVWIEKSALDLVH